MKYIQKYMIYCEINMNNKEILTRGDVSLIDENYTYNQGSLS